MTKGIPPEDVEKFMHLLMCLSENAPNESIRRVAKSLFVLMTRQIYK